MSELWLESPIDDKWVIAYRLVAQRGRIVIGELRIIPAEPALPSQHPGTCSGEWLGLRAGERVPLGGITSALRNKIRVGLHVNQLSLILKRIVSVYGEGGDVWFRERTGANRPSEKGVGGARLSALDREVLRVAVAYAAVAHTRDPIQRVAKTLRLAPGTVRRRVHQARGKYLTVTNQGVRGGALMEAAWTEQRAAKNRRTPHVEKARTR